MAAFFELFGGTGLAFLGAALAVGLCCIGSAKGTGMVSAAATGVISMAPEKRNTAAHKTIPAITGPRFDLMLLSILPYTGRACFRLSLCGGL